MASRSRAEAEKPQHSHQTEVDRPLYECGERRKTGRVEVKERGKGGDGEHRAAEQALRSIGGFVHLGVDNLAASGFPQPRWQIRFLRTGTPGLIFG